MKAWKVTALINCLVLIASLVHAQSTPSLNLEGTGNLGPGPGACPATGCSEAFDATLSGQLTQAVSQAALQMNLRLEPAFPCICGAAASTLCPAVIPCLAAGTAAPKVDSNAGAKIKPPSLRAQILALQQQTLSLQQQIDALGSGSAVLPFAPGCRAATGTGTFFGTQYSVYFDGQICSDNSSNVVLSGPISIVQSPLQTEVAWATGTLVASGPVHIPAASSNPIPISGTMAVSIVGTVEQVPALTP